MGENNVLVFYLNTITCFAKVRLRLIFLTNKNVSTRVEAARMDESGALGPQNQIRKGKIRKNLLSYRQLKKFIDFSHNCFPKFLLNTRKSINFYR